MESVSQSVGQSANSTSDSKSGSVSISVPVSVESTDETQRANCSNDWLKFFLIILFIWMIMGASLNFVFGFNGLELFNNDKDYISRDGIHIQDFCGEFLQMIWVTSVYGNIFPASISLAMIIISLIFLKKLGKYPSFAVLCFGFNLSFIWTLIVNALLFAHYKSTSQTCLDYWTSQDRGDVLNDLMRRENIVSFSTIFLGIEIFNCLFIKLCVSCM